LNCSRSYASPLSSARRTSTKLDVQARRTRSRVRLRYGAGNPTNRRRSMFAECPRTGGSRLLLFLVEELTTASETRSLAMRNTSAKHEGAPGAARRVSSWIVTRRRSAYAAWNKFYRYIFFFLYRDDFVRERDENEVPVRAHRNLESIISPHCKREWRRNDQRHVIICSLCPSCSISCTPSGLEAVQRGCTDVTRPFFPKRKKWTTG